MGDEGKDEVTVVRTPVGEPVRNFVCEVTDAVVAEVTAWHARPLEPVYPVVFFDALRVKIHDERVVRSKAVYLALAVLPFLLALAHARPRWWLLLAYGGMLGGKQPELGDLMWVVNRGLPTLGALTLLAGLLVTGRRRDEDAAEPLRAAMSSDPPRRTP